MLTNNHVKTGSDEVLTTRGVLKSDEKFNFVPAGRGTNAIHKIAKEEEIHGKEEDEIKSAVFTSLLLGWLGLPSAINHAIEITMKGIELSDEKNTLNQYMAVINMDPKKAIKPHLAYMQTNAELPDQRQGLEKSDTSAQSWSKKLEQVVQERSQKKSAPSGQSSMSFGRKMR